MRTQPRPHAFVHSMFVLDPMQPPREQQEVRAYLETHLALVDPSDPAHWTALGQREGERHSKGSFN